MPNKIKLHVGGIEYVINTDDDESYIQNLGHELNERLDQIARDNKYLSTTMVAVLAALDSMDESKKSLADAENLRTQLKSFVEDAACARLEADEARREIERLNRENQSLRNKLSGKAD